MAFKLISVKNDFTSTFIADAAQDVSDLPTDVQAGSTCTVVGNGSGYDTYMMNCQKQWVKI